MTILLGSRQAAAPTIKPVRMQEHVFLGVIWGGLVISVICCCLRFLARVRTVKKLLADDYFVVLALAFALANAIMWQIYAHNMFHIMAVSAGLELPDEGFVSIAESYSRSTIAFLVLFYSALWSIKMSFLLFFRRLGQNVRGQKVVWWPVFGFTIVTYLTCIGTIDYPCFVNSIAWETANCSTPAATSFQRMMLKLNCTWDVLTDCSIMLIPILMLRGVQMRWRRKAALTGIFSLVVITMIFAIVRTAVVSSSNTQIDTSWLFMWSAIEASVAITVSCLATFCNLFSRENARSRPIPPHKAPGSSNLFLRGSKPRDRMMSFIDTLASAPDHPHTSYQVHVESGEDMHSPINRQTINDSHDMTDFPAAVHVRKDVDIYHSSRL